MEPSSKGPLRTALQNLILPQVIRSVPDSESTLKVLIADRGALRILSHAININDLVQEGISIIELLDIRREPLPSVPAIYFLTPTPETVDRLSDEPPNQYGSFRIFFTSHLSNFLLSIVKKRARFIAKVKQFVELEVPFLALESRLFSLDRPAASLPQVYASDITPDKVRDEIGQTSSQLGHVCSLLAPNVVWTIRSDATSFTTRTLASLVREELDDIRKKALRTSSNNTGTANTAACNTDAEQSFVFPRKATVLIIDRATDLITPLVHEYSYQALAHDLLPLNYRKPGGAHIEVDDEKTSDGKKWEQLDDEDKDPVWSMVRHDFIQDAMQRVQDSFRHFVDNDAAFKIRGKQTEELDIREMSAAVRALPGSQMKADKHAMHITATRACLDMIAQLALTDLALTEQDLVIGRAADSLKVRADVMVEKIVSALQDERVLPQHRVRLLMMAQVVAEGLPGLGGETSALSSSATFRSKFQKSGCKEELCLSAALAAAVEGIERVLEVARNGSTRMQLRVNPNLVAGNDDGVSAKLRQRYAMRQEKRQRKKENAARAKRHGLHDDSELQFDVARYSPPLRSVMMDLVDGELDEGLFPTTGDLSVEAIIAGAANSSLDKADGMGADDASAIASRGRLSKFLARTSEHEDIDGKSESESTEGDDDEVQERIAEQDHIFVVFVLGGVSYSEVRAMHEVCDKRGANVIIGGSQVLTPTTYLRYMAAVADSVIRLQAMVPPLPLELGVKRAPKKETSAAAGSAVAEGDDDAGLSVQDFDEFERERQNGEIVEVVTGYKKKGAFRMFGRKK